MNRLCSHLITLKEVFLLTVLLCAVVNPAPTDLEELQKENEEQGGIQQELDLTVKGPNDNLGQDTSQENEDAMIDSTQSTDVDDIQQPNEDASDEAVSNFMSENPQKSFFAPSWGYESITREYDESVPVDSDEKQDFTSSFSEPSYDDNLSQESSFSKPFFPQQNGLGDSYIPDKSDSIEVNNEQNKRLQELLCDVLDMCGDDWLDDDEKVSENSEWYDYSSESVPEILNNDIRHNTKQETDTSDAENETDLKDSDNDIDQKILSRKKRSEEDNSKHGHRAKRDLSWDMFNDADDDTLPYTAQLDFLTEVLADNNEDANIPEDNLADVLDYIEGVRRDRLTAGDILDEFEVDEELGGLPINDANVALDHLLRKRGLSHSDMKHYVESLPTLEGMRKRNDLNDIAAKAYQRDIVVAAENQLAAEELENIETKAQVAAALLDDAAMLIALIENMAVDLVGDYLGLNEQADDDEDVIDYPVEFEEFPQYLPPVPPVSVEKRIGRQRTRDYPVVYDYPFVPEDLERPFGAFESMSKPNYMGSNSGLRGSNFRRPPSRNTYKGFGRVPAPPPFVGKHIGIFPNDDFIRPRYRRDQLPRSLLDNLLKQKRGIYDNDYEALPLIADDIQTEDPDVWETLANESPRMFPIGNKAMGRYGPDGHPYIDGFFTPYQNADEDSLDRLWPLDNTLDRDIPLDNGLQEAYEAAAMMQDKIDHDNQLLEEQDNALGMAADKAYVGNILSNIFRERIK